MNAPSTRRSPILVWFATVLVTLAVLALAACAGDIEEELTPTTITLQKIGGFEGGVLGAAEITAYDALSKRLFVVNGANNTGDWWR